MGERDETCPVSTEGWMRRVHFVREGGGGEGPPTARTSSPRRREYSAARAWVVGAVHAHTRTRTHRHTLTNSRTHARTLTHTHTHTHTPPYKLDAMRAAPPRTDRTHISPHRAGERDREGGHRPRPPPGRRSPHSPALPPTVRDAACPISTGRGTRRVRLVRGEGRGVST